MLVLSCHTAGGDVVILKRCEHDLGSNHDAGYERRGLYFVDDQPTHSTQPCPVHLCSYMFAGESVTNDIGA